MRAHLALRNRWSGVVLEFEHDSKGDIICGCSQCMLLGGVRGDGLLDTPLRGRCPSWASSMESLMRKERKDWPSTAADIAFSTLRNVSEGRVAAGSVDGARTLCRG